MNDRWLARPLTVACGCFLILLALGQIAAAQYTTSLGATNSFLEPTLWSVGDPDSTYQEWNVKETLTGATPNSATPITGISNSAVSFDPFNPNGTATLSATPPFFGPPSFDSGTLLTSTNNFYAFAPGPGDPTPEGFGAFADIPNYGVGDPGEGTYVTVQTGSSLTGDDIGNLPGTLEIVDIATGDPLLGGDNASAVITELTENTAIVNGFMGPVPYDELRYEFFLPGHFGDVRVQFENAISASMDTLRVDTFIGPAPTSTAVPEPGSATALLIAAATAGIAYAIVRRRKPRIVPRRS